MYDVERVKIYEATSSFKFIINICKLIAKLYKFKIKIDKVYEDEHMNIIDTYPYN